MFTKEAIIELQQGEAIKAAREAMSGRDETSLVALPSDFQVHDLESSAAFRRRARGKMNTTSLQAFSDYSKQHAEDGATVFVAAETMCAVAVLNLGTPDLPGHADNLAVLTLRKSAAYAALRKIADGRPLKQIEVAEFLEDWAPFLSCSSDGNDIPTGKAIAAIRKITIEAMRKLESSEQQLSASRSAFESVQATSVEPIPTTIVFGCAPYPELESREFSLRLGVLTGGDKPAITLRIVKLEEQEEAMAEELSGLVRDMFAGDAEVVMGTYSKSA